MQVGCSDPEKPRLGCEAQDTDIREMLATAGEAPWCDGRTAPREGYRMIWGYPELPVVVSIHLVGDSAVVHAFRPLVDLPNYWSPQLDTTFVLYPLKLQIHIRGGNWRPGEPSRTGFDERLWREGSTDALPGTTPPPPLRALEAIRDRRYNVIVRGHVGNARRFSATLHMMAQLALADQYFAIRRNAQGELAYPR
jgi:hypothetical protein